MSALIHAATMVTAGVYLVVRSHVLFEFSGPRSPSSLVIGLVSAIYAALASIGQFDLKRALAYSTMSQIGFMFFAAGMRLLHRRDAAARLPRVLQGAAVPHGRQRAARPATTRPTCGGWAGCGRRCRSRPRGSRSARLSLAGIPPLAGFFAKDQIVGFARDERTGSSAWVLASVGAFLSALYIARPAVPDVLRPPAHRGARARGAGADARAARGPRVPERSWAALLLGLTAEGGLLAGFLEPVVGAVEHGEARAVRGGPDRDLDRARGLGGRGGVLGLGLRPRRLGGVPRTPARARRAGSRTPST